MGLTDAQKSYFRAYLPERKLVEIKTIEDLADRLPARLKETGVVACRSSQIIQGLLAAKFTHNRLILDEEAPPLDGQRLNGGEGILVIENSAGVNEVAAINYAFSINADVVLASPIDSRDIIDLPRNLVAWSKDRSDRALDGLRREATKRCEGISFRKYNFATFFTVGLPYGLFIGNVIPCTHVLRDVNCGVFIANNIAHESAPLTFGSGLLFSSLDFASDETSDVAKVLEESNCVVNILLGKTATLKQLDNYGSFFPFDVMHICAHGGETDGYHTIHEFTDRNGCPHTLESYEVVGAAPVGGDMVDVTVKTIFASLDGFRWRSEPLSSYPKYVFEDMLKAIKSAHDHDDDVGVKRTNVNQPIALSCHIQCYDSIHQGVFDSLAGLGQPIVFNNSCSSSHEMAAALVDAGARCYIGTLWSVENATATQAARVFYQSATRQGNVMTALFEMNTSISDKRYKNIYMLWGLHFASFEKPSQKSDEKILEGS